MHLERLLSSSSASSRCISGPNIYLLVSLIIFHAYITVKHHNLGKEMCFNLSPVQTLLSRLMGSICFYLTLVMQCTL